MKVVFYSIFLLSAFNSFANFDFSEMEFIEKADNPFQIVGAHPGTPVTELDETTLRTIRRITGWNILDLNKFMDEQTFQRSIRELTEREGNTIKKILDSHFVLKHIHEKKALIRFNLFGKEFKLGSEALEVLKNEEIRDLKIYYKNELGHFQIEWGAVEVSLSKDLKFNTPKGYLIKFHGIAATPENQQKINELEAKRAKILEQYPDKKWPLKVNLEFATISAEIGSLKVATGSDPRVFKVMSELQEEFRMRTQVSGTPTTQELKKLFNIIEISPCEKAYLLR